VKKGWRTTRLSNVLEVQNGYAFESKSFHSSHGMPLIRIRDLEAGIETQTRYRGEYEEKYLVNTGDLLIGMDGAFGCFEWKGGPALLNQRVCRLQGFASRLLPRFVFYGVNSYLKAIEEVTGYATVKHLSSKQILAIEFPLPPLPEQQRIVDILDEAFEGLVTAQANAEKNHQNASALSESHVQSVFAKRGKGWEEKPFEELIENNVIGLTKGSRDQGEDKAWPYVKMNNITRDNRFDFSRFTCVDATEEEVSKFSLRDGDFLFNTRNSYELVGKSCIYEANSNDVVLFNNNIMRVRFKSGVDARFVLLAFSSKPVSDELNALKSGTTNVSAIYFKDLKSLVVPVPPIAAQKAIAERLDALSKETQHLAHLYERKLASLAALKKSLLHQAFTGNL
jgi:type I restriction enzyme, S subunit